MICKQVSMYCAECDLWTQDYDETGKCIQCGKDIFSGNADQLIQPDLYYVGKPIKLS